MYKVLVACFIIIFFCGVCFSQNDSAFLYTSLEQALLFPKKVQRLSLKKQKLKEIPVQVFLLTNLKELDLSSNKIKEIPKEIAILTQLEKLNISNNYITSLPTEIGDLTHLKRLDLNRNDLDSLPSTIGLLVNLQELILWSTYITELPEEIKNLKDTLLYLDMRAIRMNPKKQKTIKNLLPNTDMRMDRACNCN